MASAIHQAMIDEVQGRTAGRTYIISGGRSIGRTHLRRQMLAFIKWHARQIAPRKDNTRALVSRNKREGSL